MPSFSANFGIDISSFGHLKKVLIFLNLSWVTFDFWRYDRFMSFGKSSRVTSSSEAQSSEQLHELSDMMNEWFQTIDMIFLKTSEVKSY
jgi:hypothetical protein